MASTPQGALRRFAAAALFMLVAAGAAAASGREVVGSMRAPIDALFPGSGTGSYGFVRAADGTITYFRVNGRNTHARSIDGSGRVSGSFTGADGRARDFAVTVPQTGGFVELTVDSDEEELVG